MLSDGNSASLADAVNRADLTPNLAASPLLFASPRLMSDVSAWVQHIPFAFALIPMLRPRQIVELGTHKGDSYCAMCQAVDMAALDTRCCAVDTWRGDPQSGPYDESILQQLRAHHDPLYGRFSTLRCATFNAAADSFADRSIDLLHLDGLHHYGAVRHDFENWLPKLSDRGVVLLHDTHVHTPDFGVHRLWEELRAMYPSFAFEHGCGLGILAVGRDIPEAFRAFLSEAEAAPARVRGLFAALGERLELRRGLSTLAADIVAREKHANAWRKVVGQPQRHILPTDRDAASLVAQNSGDLKAHLDALHETSMNQHEDLLTIIGDNREMRAALTQLATDRQCAELQVSQLREVVDSLLAEREVLRSPDVSALVARALADRARYVATRPAALIRAVTGPLARRLSRSRIVRIPGRLPPL